MATNAYATGFFDTEADANADVAEEISLGKTVDTQTVRDTVRHTAVEVGDDRTPPGK
jgi:hypothetical protein